MVRFVSDLIHKLPEKWRPVPVIFGGCLFHLTLGAFYTIGKLKKNKIYNFKRDISFYQGNMTPYLASYLRNPGFTGETDVTYSTMSYFLTAQLVLQAAFMVVGGFIERRVGPFWTSLLGGWIGRQATKDIYIYIKQIYNTNNDRCLVFSFGILITYVTIKVSFAACKH